MIRRQEAADAPVQPHSILEDRVIANPFKWEQYFSNLDNVTFVQIRSGKRKPKWEQSGRADPILNYATQHRWTGYTVHANADNLDEVKKHYANVDSVKALHMVVTDHDEALPTPANTEVQNLVASQGGDAAAKAKTEQVSTLSFSTFWTQHVKPSLPHVDILDVDVQGNELKLLKAALKDPMPRFVVFKYINLGRHDYRATGTTLEEQGYRYVGRDGEDELHELIKRA